MKVWKFHKILYKIVFIKLHYKLCLYIKTSVFHRVQCFAQKSRIRKATQSQCICIVLPISVDWFAKTGIVILAVKPIRCIFKQCYNFQILHNLECPKGLKIGGFCLVVQFHQGRLLLKTTSKRLQMVTKRYCANSEMVWAYANIIFFNS